MTGLRVFHLFAGAAMVLVSSHVAHGQCSMAGRTQLQPRTLYLVSPKQPLVPLRRMSSVPFDDSTSFLYVIDTPDTNGLNARRTAGVLAVRLVSTAGNGANGRGAQSSQVRLKRDQVDTRRTTRSAWNGQVKSKTYYHFHNPSLPASDSHLRRHFHTSYVYIAGSPERDTYSQRYHFHFPEMSGASSELFSNFFSPYGYVEAADKRYEAQIKYYRPRPEERCVLIQPDLQSDDIRLSITISEIDNGNSANWRIDSGVPSQ